MNNKEIKLVSALAAALSDKHCEFNVISGISPHQVVEDYLKKGEITYFMRINMYDIFESMGIEEPTIDPRAVSMYHTKAHKASLLLLGRLREFGFKADRLFKKNKKIKNPDTLHAPRATVYTNSPATPGFKAIKARKKAEEIMSTEHSSGVDLSDFRQDFGKLYVKMMELEDRKRVDAERDIIRHQRLVEKEQKFLERYNKDEDKLFDKYQHKTTRLYKEYLSTLDKKGEE